MDSKIRDFIAKTIRALTLFSSVGDLMLYAFLLSVLYIFKEVPQFDELCWNKTCFDIYIPVILCMFGMATALMLILGWAIRSWKLFIPYVLIKVFFTFWFVIYNLRKALVVTTEVSSAFIMSTLLLYLIMSALLISVVVFEARNMRKKVKPLFAKTLETDDNFGRIANNIYHVPVMDLWPFVRSQDEAFIEKQYYGRFQDPKMDIRTFSSFHVEFPILKTVDWQKESASEEMVQQWICELEKDHTDVADHALSTQLKAEDHRNEPDLKGFANHKLIIEVSPYSVSSSSSSSNESFKDTSSVIEDEFFDFEENVVISMDAMVKASAAKSPENGSYLEEVEEDLLDVGTNPLQDHGVERSFL